MCLPDCMSHDETSGNNKPAKGKQANILKIANSSIPNNLILQFTTFGNIIKYILLFSKIYFSLKEN